MRKWRSLRSGRLNMPSPRVTKFKSQKRTPLSRLIGSRINVTQISLILCIRLKTRQKATSILIRHSRHHYLWVKGTVAKVPLSYPSLSNSIRLMYKPQRKWPPAKDVSSLKVLALQSQPLTWGEYTIRKRKIRSWFGPRRAMENVNMRQAPAFWTLTSRKAAQFWRRSHPRTHKCYHLRQIPPSLGKLQRHRIHQILTWSTANIRKMRRCRDCQVPWKS